MGNGDGNGVWWRRAGVIVAILVVASGVVGGYAVLGWKTEDNSEEIAQLDAHIETDIRPRLRMVENAVVEHRAIARANKETLDRIERKLP